MEKILVDRSLLLKVAEFIDLAVKQINQLSTEVKRSQEKTAALKEPSREYKNAVIKVAETLRDADMEYLCEDFSLKNFVKKAERDPAYLASVLLNAVNSAETSQLGLLSNAKTANVNQDPIYQAAFGTGKYAKSELVFD